MKIKFTAVLVTLFFFSNITAQDTWLQVSGGTEFTAALKSDGTIWTWGFNGNGQLGNGTLNTSVLQVQVGTDNDWVHVESGAIYAMAIKDDGSLWGWGFNGAYNIFDGSTDNILEPIQVGTDTDWSKVSAGQAHTLLIKTDGTLWGMGFNTLGQLGTGFDQNTPGPVQIGSDTTWWQIATGGAHSLALKTDSTLWATGANFTGQLGDSTTNSSLVFVPVGSMKWKKISAGFEYSGGINSEGQLYTWGVNANGQLGLPGVLQADFPTLVDTNTNWENIDLGATHGFVINSENELYGWGSNLYGCVGSSTPDQVDSLLRIGSGSDWIQVTAGDGLANSQSVFGFSSFGIRGDATSICGTGANYVGQLGNGSSEVSILEFECDIAPLIVSLEEIGDKDQILITPNPANDYFMIEGKGSTDAVEQIAIYDISGKLLLSQKTTTFPIRVDISHLKQGTYVLRLMKGKHLKTTKLIIQ